MKKIFFKLRCLVAVLLVLATVSSITPIKNYPDSNTTISLCSNDGIWNFTTR